MNSNKLDIFLDRLQEDILEDARRAYGPKGYDRWLKPRYNHAMDNPDSRASLTGECGDTIEIFLQIDRSRNTVSDGSYRTTGCASSSICGSFAVEMAIGRSPDEILDMTAADLLDEVGRFPKEEEHCAHLAITTVKEAVNLYMQKQAAGHTAK